MAFEDSFDELDRMLLAKSTDYEKMRALVQRMRQADELARMLGPAQDRLYASIAHGHRKALIWLTICQAGNKIWFRFFHGASF